MKKLLTFLAFALPAIPAVWVAFALMGFMRPQAYPDANYGMHPFAAAGWGFAVYLIIISGEGLLLIFVQMTRGLLEEIKRTKTRKGTSKNLRK